VAANVQPVASSGLMKYSDIILAGVVVAVLAMMIIPLPEQLLDGLIVIDIASALTILLVSLYAREPLDFSVFPSLLLVMTLFRLGLNISASRLILLQAHAGTVIDAFGSFVVGGNYVVGVVVFLILMVIQFVVITNGAGRVAEVGARFTLDAMPGKQLAIDADLNAGLITEAEARARRRAIQREADFYGAMDGASKFVKGDAIAAIIITLINSLGGIVIGVLQLHMDVGRAAQTYTLLTVGDGLVSQVPALLISTATGVIVTRSAADTSLGRDMLGQVFTNPRALGIVGTVLLLFGLVPGLPKLPFFVISAGLIGGAFVLRNSARRAAQAPAEEPAKPASDEQNVADLLHVDPLELEIGYNLVPLVDAQRGGSLINRIALIRRQVALDLGIMLPTIRIRDNLQLAPNSYSIKLRGVEIARGEVLVDHHLALSPTASDETLEGVRTVEPAFGLPAIWVTGAQRERAELLGYTVIDPASVVTTHLTEVIKRNAPAILGRQEVQNLLNGVRQTAPAVADDLVPNLLSLGEVQKVLQNLVRERVSIRDLVAILEALGDHARATRDPDVLTEYARRAVARSLCQQYREPDGIIYGITLDPHLEQELFEALQTTDQGAVIAWPPSRTQRLLQRLGQELERLAATGHLPIVLTSARIRLPFRRLTERALPNLAVLSFAEVASQGDVRAVATLRLD